MLPPLVVNAASIRTGTGPGPTGEPAALISLYNHVAAATIALAPEQLDAVIASLTAIRGQLAGAGLVLASDVPMAAADRERAERIVQRGGLGRNNFLAGDVNGHGH